MDIEYIPSNAKFSKEQAESYYGVKRSVEAIVLHWWNSPSSRPNFNGNFNYLTNPPNGYPSANCVIGWDELNNRIRIIDSIRYPDVAFTTGGSINARSVAIECDPYAIAGQPHHEEVVKAIGYRVHLFRKEFGWRVPLKWHKDYSQTACSDIDLALIDYESDKWAHGWYDPTPEPSISFIKLPTPKIYMPKNTAVLIDFKTNIPVQTFNSSQQITVFGQAYFGEEIYLMTKYSFGDADTTNMPAFYRGFNTRDMQEYVQTPETPPEPVVITPVTPPVTPVVMPPKPSIIQSESKAEGIRWLQSLILGGGLSTLPGLLIRYYSDRHNLNLTEEQILTIQSLFAAQFTALIRLLDKNIHLSTSGIFKSMNGFLYKVKGNAKKTI